MAEKDESEKDEPIIRTGPDGHEPPVVRDKRRVDPETGDVREPEAGASDDDAPADGEDLSAEDQALLDEASKDLVADMRNDMLRAQAELVNFRQRVERDRTANREAVIAEVLRSLLPVIDDLALAEAHGDLVEGAPLTLIAQKLRTTFEKYGLKEVGAKGEPFDPTIHEAVVQLPDPAATSQTVADVIQAGYILGERLVRPAKVVVSVPAK